MRKSTLILSATSAVMAASSLWLWDQWQDERALNLDLRARAAALARQHEPAPVAAPVVAPAKLSTVSGNVAQPRSAIPAAMPTANYPGRLQQRLLKNPQFRQAFRNQQRQVVETEFRDLPKFLNLSPEEGAHLFDLMAEQSLRVLELQWRNPLRAEEGAPPQPTYEELRAQVEAQDTAELTKLMGAQNVNRLQEFRSTLQSRSEVDSVRSELARGADPLREDQVEPMVGVVNAELQRMNQELREVVMTRNAGVSAEQILETKRTDLAIAANQRIVDAAGAILTNAQLAALKDLYRRQRLQMETQIEVMRLQREAVTSEAQLAAPSGTSGQQ